MALILITACGTMPGGVSKDVSNTDGTSTVSVEPGFLSDGLIKVGVFRSSKMDPNQAVLKVMLKGMAIGLNKSLKINIDGQTREFESLDIIAPLDATTHQFFVKRYAVDMDYVRKMVEGKSVWIKVTTIDGKYMEGEFSKDNPSAARPGFRDFLAQAK